MEDLEKTMMRHYKFRQRDHSKKNAGVELVVLQKWAEHLILKRDGKLTISSENEIQRVLDKLRLRQS